MERKMVQGIVSTYLDGEGREVIALSMPRTPEDASLSFNLTWILKHWFMGKNITIVVNDEDGNPSIENDDVSLVSDAELAKMYGVA